MKMVVGLSLSESAIEVLSITQNYNSVFSCGFSISRKPVILIAPRIKKQSRITTRSALSSDGAGIGVLDKEFEFKPSFDEYLKAMESVKVDRGNNNNNNNHSSNSISNSPRKKKIVKRIVREEEQGSDEEGASVREYSRKGGFQKRSAFIEEDSRKRGFREDNGFGNVEKQQNRISKIRTVNKRGSNESKFVDMERAAFRSLETEDIIDKPRVSRVDMEERIQKLAKW